MKHKNQLKHHKNLKDTCHKLLKNLPIFIVSLLLISIFFFLLSENYRQHIGNYIITSVVLSALANQIIPGISKTKTVALLPLLSVLFGITLPSLVAISYPEFYSPNILVKKEYDIKHDSDLDDMIKESVAIETVSNDIDYEVFKQFYKISYIKNGILKSEPEALESEKIQLIMDSIINDIEQSTIDNTKYTTSELNSGTYGNLTNAANREEHEYREKENDLSNQQKIDYINSYLKKRIEAYQASNTSELARLIGHTYAELSQYQNVNDNIYSNCSAISYYFDYCCLSKPEAKSKMYYEIGVRFNRIAEIAQNIYKKESSEEYRKLCLDSLYMSSAYYKLYRHSFVEDYKNNFYLAITYKSLSKNMENIHDRVTYLEESLNILFKLSSKLDNLNTESKTSLLKTLYNTIIEYESIPLEYWTKYSKNYISEKKNLAEQYIN